jgi:hypothetical protein
MTDKTLVMDSGLFLHHFVFFSSRAIYSEVDTFCFFFFFWRPSQACHFNMRKSRAEGHSMVTSLHIHLTKNKDKCY